MERKLIFLDIDGTLVSGLGSPSPLVREAVRSARAKGHLAFLCTGRNMPIIVPKILEIGFDGVIASAGAHIEAGGQVLLDSLLPEETVQECLSVFHENGLYCRLEDREAIYTDPQMEALLRSASPDGANSELVRMQRELESGLPIRPYAAYPRQGAYKLCFTGLDMAPVERARAALEDRFAFVVHPFRLGGNCINGEIIPRTVDKGRAMERLCRHFGADAADAVAFGDSMNDAPVLRLAGLGVAMGNACDELKALADAVCEDVAHDGVYHELRRRGLC